MLKDSFHAGFASSSVNTKLLTVNFEARIVKYELIMSDKIIYGAYYTVAGRALAVVYYDIKCRSGCLLQLSRSLSDGPRQYVWVHSSL